MGGEKRRKKGRKSNKSSRVNAGAERVKIKDTKETKRRSAKRKERGKKERKRGAWNKVRNLQCCACLPLITRSRCTCTNAHLYFHLLILNHANLHRALCIYKRDGTQ